MNHHGGISQLVLEIDSIYAAKEGNETGGATALVMNNAKAVLPVRGSVSSQQTFIQ